ncbi:SdpI family protein, partial [Nocardia cyriacigeorgica]|uniref:SdpI family protein n=1 Tax=Nocardia cyriacigeorgica TaxID=135487 RepID=UPI002457904E
MVVVPIILFLLAAVALAIGVLGLAGKLPRNRFVGVHTDEALSNDEVFRVANRVAAPTSLAAGALLFCGGLVSLAAGGGSALRGSYGGILMVGLATSLLGMSLVNWYSAGAGVLLGINALWDDRRA